MKMNNLNLSRQAENGNIICFQTLLISGSRYISLTLGYPYGIFDIPSKFKLTLLLILYNLIH